MTHLVYCCEPPGSKLQTALSHWPQGRAVGLREWRHSEAPELLVIACQQWGETWARIVRQWQTATLVICQGGGPTDIDAALDAGATTVITGAFDPERLSSVIHTTLGRHRREQALRRELAQTRRALAERPMIERAKGLLMDKHRLSEEQAYRTLREAAMKQQVRLAELARRLLERAE